MIINEDGTVTTEKNDKVHKHVPKWKAGIYSPLLFITHYNSYDVYQVKPSPHNGGNPEGKYCFYGPDNTGGYRTWFDTFELAIEEIKRIL